MGEKEVQCHNCKYYYITWDMQFPYGCKLYGIKSKQVPYVIVSKSIGMPCNEFIEKSKDK